MGVSHSHKCDGVTHANYVDSINYDILEESWTLDDARIDASLHNLNFCPFCGCWLDDELDPNSEPVNRMPKAKAKPGAWSPK